MTALALPTTPKWKDWRSMARKVTEPISKSTPVTIGLAIILAIAIAGSAWRASEISGDMERLNVRVTSLEAQNEKNMVQNSAILSRLVRIETLLETANAKLGIPAFPKP